MGLGARGVSLPVVAREAITGWLDGQEPAPRPGLGLQAAVFVTLRAPDLTLRGCMGSLEPLTDDVVEETQRAAILAAAKDPRFPALAYPELSELVIEVSVLGAAEPIVSAGELDPGRYGVIVTGTDGRRGVLLPSVGGIDSVSQQIRVARERAGLHEDDPIEVRRFAVEKFG